MQLLLAT